MRVRREWLPLFVVSLLLGAHLSAQTLMEFPLRSPSPLPTKIVAGPDGNLWFIESRTEIGGNPKIGRITTEGIIVDYPIEDGSVALPWDIASGPEGNIWFTQSDIDGGHSAVNRMTPSGVLARFPIVPPFEGPWGIATGPDGNLWLTQVDF